jgi:hypothetical protein
MASAARITANRLNAKEGTGPGTPRGTAAMRRSPLRYPPVELRSTAPPTAMGEIAKIVHWHSRPDLSNEIRGRGSGKSQFHAAGIRSSLVQRDWNDARIRAMFGLP